MQKRLTFCITEIFTELEKIAKVQSVKNSNAIEGILTTDERINATPISKADICKILPDVSATTVESVLGKMLKEGQIRKTGSGKNTRYIRA